MNTIIRKVIFIIIFCGCCLPPLAAFELYLWRRPEMAEQNSLFIDTAVAPLIFTGVSSWKEAYGLPLAVRADYLLPLPLPVSLGVFLSAPYPNLKHFGARLAYHIDIDDPATDIYCAYVFDCGFIRNDLLLRYNDTPSPLYYYDFRAGFRRAFGNWLCLGIETAFQLKGFIFFISVKAF